MLRPGALGDTLLAVPALRWLRRAYQPLGAASEPLKLAAHGGAARLLATVGEVDEGLAFDDQRVGWLFRDAPPPEPVVAWMAAEAAPALKWAQVVAPSRPPGTEHVARYLLRTVAGIATNEPSLGRDVGGPERPSGGNRGTEQPSGAWGRAEQALGGNRGTEQSLGTVGGTELSSRGNRAAGHALGGAEPFFDQSPLRVAAWRSDDVLIHVGSGAPAKNWPPARFANVIELLGGPVRLIVGEADTLAAAQVEACLGRALPRLEHLSLEALAARLAGCRAYLGNDSGVSHLAGLCGARTVVLFGPTSPHLWHPLGPDVHVRSFDNTPESSATLLEVDHP